MGRPRKYPIQSLKVGESVLLPWLAGQRPNWEANQQPMHNSIYQEQRRFNKKFRKEGSAKGLFVTRIK